MRHHKALHILVAALLLGVAADQLLRFVPWGMNALLWVTFFLGIALFLRRVALLPALASLAIAGCLVWRTNPALMALDILLLLLFLPMLAAGARGVRMAAATMTQLVTAHVTTVVQTIIGVPQLLFSDLEWRRAQRPGAMRGAGVVLRGVLFALPALIIFGALLTSADATFARLFGKLFDFDLADIVQHLLVTTIAATICAGFLRSLAFSGEAPALAAPSFLRLPIAESTIALGLVDALFATFVVVQIPYLFHGSANLNTAEYARRGFFELVVVVALVVPMLLAVEWLVDKSDAHRLLVFRVIACAQVALVLVIASSAWRRMQLYRDAFGLTQDRVFATALMLWLAVVLVWLALTVLTGHRNRFAIGALVTGVIATVALNAINPDALIVRTNVARAIAGKRSFDALYASQLSDDAAPAILENARWFDQKSLYLFVKRPRTIGWRTWNLSRARAIEAVRAYESKATPPIARP